MHIRQLRYGLIFLCLCLGFVSCRNTANQVDVSKVPYELKASDFYKDFAQIDSLNISAGLTQLKAKYPNFLDFYLDTLLPFGPLKGEYDQALAKERIGQIFTFPDYKKLNDTVLLAFPNTAKITEALTKTGKYIRHYLPKAKLPKEVIYFTSCLNQWTALTHDDQLGIGLDMFLGANFPPYRSINMPDYALLRHTPDQIPVWAARAIYSDNYETFNQNKNLLELMVENGKTWYYLTQVLPEMPKEKLFGYTESQWKWAEENQSLIYNFFLRDNLLYEKGQQKIMRYLTEGPNSAGFPAEAPGNIASYLGYKIVESYANKTNKNLEDILNENEAQRLFQAANYKP